MMSLSDLLRRKRAAGIGDGQIYEPPTNGGENPKHRTGAELRQTAAGQGAGVRVLQQLNYTGISNWLLWLLRHCRVTDPHPQL